MQKYRITVKGGKKFEIDANNLIAAANEWKYGTRSGDKYTKWDIIRVEIVGKRK